jgi:hypothetical protein
VSNDAPRIDGLTHTIIRPGGDNDVPWIAVRSQRNPDGTESHVWERWVAFSVEPLYLALFARWDPGMIVRRHGAPQSAHAHRAGGRVDLRRRAVRRGHASRASLRRRLRALRRWARRGRAVRGDDGAIPRSWSDEPEAMRRILAERRVEQLPDPPIELPAGLDDLRGVFSVGGSG